MSMYFVVIMYSVWILNYIQFLYVFCMNDTTDVLLQTFLPEFLIMLFLKLHALSYLYRLTTKSKSHC